MAADAVAMDERQTRIFTALHGRSPRLAGIYRALLEALRFPADEDCEIARASVIGHCGRELMNGAPAVLSGVDIPRPSPNSSALKDRLPSLLKDVDLGLDQDLIPVSRSAAATLDALIKTVAQEQGRNRRLASAAVTDETDNKHPAIQQWIEAQKFFLKWTHLDRASDGERAGPADDVIRAHLRVVEDLIEVRTAAFFDAVRSIDDLLAVANATDEDET